MPRLEEQTYLGARNDRLRVVVSIVMAAAIGVDAAIGQDSANSGRSDAATLSGLHPTVGFVRNDGQWNDGARFHAVGGAMGLRVEPGALSLHRPAGIDGRGAVVRLTFEGASPDATLEAGRPVPGEYHFFLGADPAGWRTHVPWYSDVTYRDLYPGIDVRVHHDRGRFEYDLDIVPNAALERFVVRCEGAEGMEIAPDGSLVLETSVGRLVHSPPRAWRVGTSGELNEVACRYTYVGEFRYAVVVPAFDSTVRHVIDPGLEWSTFLGGVTPEPGPFAQVNGARDVAVTPDRSTIVVGQTGRIDFPTTPGAYQETYVAGNDAFVTRINPSGSQLVYSTFIGGTLSELCEAVALASSGAAVIVGATGSDDFPTTPSAYDPIGLPFGASEGFVVRLSPGGDALEFSTFLAGSTYEALYDVALSPEEDVAFVGETISPDLPTTPGAYASTLTGTTTDAYVGRLSAGGGTLLFATYFGGTSTDFPQGVAVGLGGSTTICGQTSSADLPMTLGAFDMSISTQTDAFVTCFDATGSSLLYSTFIGGTENDRANAVDVDPAGFTTVGGSTSSEASFPITPGAFQTSCTGNCIDAFVLRLNPTGTALVWSTRFGGVDGEILYRLHLDSSGAPTIVGATGSDGAGGFPTTKGAYEEAYFSASAQIYLSRLRPDGSGLLYSTTFGGVGTDGGAYGLSMGLAIDHTGAATISGAPGSSDFPFTGGAYDTVFAPGKAFISRFDMLPTGVTRFGASTPGCAGPLAIAVTSMPHPGNADFGFTCLDAPPNVVGFLALSPGALPAAVNAAGAGLWLDPNGLVLVPIQSDSLGAVYTCDTIPAGLLPGLTAYTQFFWPDPCAPGGWSASSALEVVLQP